MVKIYIQPKEIGPIISISNIMIIFRVSGVIRHFNHLVRLEERQKSLEYSEHVCLTEVLTVVQPYDGEHNIGFTADKDGYRKTTSKTAPGEAVFFA